MRCEFGYCITCDKEIANKCGSCDSKKPNNQYTEVAVKWSNGANMQMACCSDCSRDYFWKANKEEMTKAVWQAWDKSGGSYSRDVVIV